MDGWMDGRTDGRVLVYGCFTVVYGCDKGLGPIRDTGSL